MLIVIGDLVADLIVLGGATLERGTDNPAEVRLTRGGSAANVAAAAASAVPTRFIGCVGVDPLATALIADLESAGVDVRVQRAERTGAIVVLVDAVGERTMITDRGAAAELAAIDPAWLTGARWLHLPLYGFAEPGSRQALTDAATSVAAEGGCVSVDLSSVATLRALGARAVAEVLRRISPDVVFANRDEADVAGSFGLTTRGVLVVKRGPEPVLVHERGAVAEIAVDPVDDVLDSTGAGDAFAAGYIVAALAGADAAAAARAGGVRAMAALRRAGAL
ncbi:sugar/nucleoside kinase (ribokinase family) [Microbacterium terrae]|uniref:2-dehydro-3-deoxygluconokinase n=1 Tax=Microbacterium terrae TaxID=69369 RepID=A0A0M2GW97_9MICO|nr:PfkB family carbohydrate kinase [Microbacterium terrae]KJL38014.1 2-dehydro-3-deoxygluconokinase [Microbacterium terrae]MBP1077426.1 sugar/nucleoside kinase (ribokinase family) [Microbacterium terrae]GLJ99033.1 hypothetical protein GCM10017594_22300 [Microbacterium terrae]